VIERGQQMPTRLVGHPGPAQCLPVDRHHAPRARHRSGALPDPGADRVLEGVSIQVCKVRRNVDSPAPRR
jgi:hypothetical protein